MARFRMCNPGGNGSLSDEQKIVWALRYRVLGEIEEVKAEIMAERRRLGLPTKGHAVQSISQTFAWIDNGLDAPQDQEVLAVLKKYCIDPNKDVDEQDSAAVRAALYAAQSALTPGWQPPVSPPEVPPTSVP